MTARSLEARAQRQPARQRSALAEDLARARGFERHQSRPPAIEHARGDRGGIDIEAREIFERDVDASLAPVERHVLPEIGQLQRCADRIAFPQALFVVTPVQRKQQQATDRVGGAAAVVGDGGKRVVALDVDVLRERGQQIAETAAAAKRARGSRRPAPRTAGRREPHRARSSRARERNA